MSRMLAPDLGNDAKRILELVAKATRSKGSYIRGGEALKTLGMDKDQLVTALEELVQKDLVTVAGPRTPSRIDFAVISAHPANRGFIVSY